MRVPISLFLPTSRAEMDARGWDEPDVVLVSGGLGPTRDDLTSLVLAKTFGREHVLDEDALAGIYGTGTRIETQTLYLTGDQVEGIRVTAQGPGDLGDRMLRAFARVTGRTSMRRSAN